jgi:hypothetical protein
MESFEPCSAGLPRDLSDLRPGAPGGGGTHPGVFPGRRNRTPETKTPLGVFFWSLFVFVFVMFICTVCTRMGPTSGAPAMSFASRPPRDYAVLMSGREGAPSRDASNARRHWRRNDSCPDDSGTREKTGGVSRMTSPPACCSLLRGERWSGETDPEHGSANVNW